MADDVQQLLRHYSALSDEELLSLAITRNDLTSKAGAALDKELSRRNLTPDDINSFAESLREIDEPLPNPYAEPLPPPQELPEDFFEDRDELANASPSSRRTRGIILITASFWLGVAFSIFVGIAVQMTAVRLFCFAYAIVLFIVGSALFRLRRWAYYAAIVIVSVDACLYFLFIVARGVLRLLGYSPSDPLRSVYYFLAMIYTLVIVTYLLLPKIRDPARWN